jgi:hypothetical protein
MGWCGKRELKSESRPAGLHSKRAVLSQLFLTGVKVYLQGAIRVWLIERLMLCHGAREKSVKVG